VEKEVADKCDRVLCTSYATVSSSPILRKALSAVQSRLSTIVSLGSLVADLAIKEALIAGFDVATHPIICDQQFYLACFRVAFKTKKTLEKSVGLSITLSKDADAYIKKVKLKTTSKKLPFDDEYHRKVYARKVQNRDSDTKRREGIRRAIVAAGVRFHKICKEKKYIINSSFMKLMDPFVNPEAKMMATNTSTSIVRHFYNRQWKVVHRQVEEKLKQRLAAPVKTDEDKKRFNRIKLALTKKIISWLCGFTPPTFQNKTKQLLVDERKLIDGVFESISMDHAMHLPPAAFQLSGVKIDELETLCNDHASTMDSEEVKNGKLFDYVYACMLGEEKSRIFRTNLLSMVRLDSTLNQWIRATVDQFRNDMGMNRCRLREKDLKRNPTQVIPYMNYLNKYCGSTHVGKIPSRRWMRTFHILPQYKMKARFVTFDQSSIFCAMKIAGFAEPLPKHLKATKGRVVDQEELSKFLREKRFGWLPKALRAKFWDMFSITTLNGIQWHTFPSKLKKIKGGKMDLLKHLFLTNTDKNKFRGMKRVQKFLLDPTRTRISPGFKVTTDGYSVRFYYKVNKTKEEKKEEAKQKRLRRKQKNQKGGSRKRKKTKQPTAGQKKKKAKKIIAKEMVVEAEDEKIRSLPKCAETEDDDEHKGMKIITEKELLKRNRRTMEYKNFELGTAVTDMKERNAIYMGIDPGHANVMTGGTIVYDNPKSHNLPKPETRGQRKKQRDKRLEALGVCKYSLTNKAYRSMTDATRSRVEHEQRLLLPENKDWLAAQRALSETKRRDPGLDTTEEHVGVYMEHFGALKRQAFSPHLRANRLRRFTFTRRSYRKIAAQIRVAVQKLTRRMRRIKGKIVLVWGAGSFGPTSRGHASAPNKKLREGLRAFFPIVMCSEYKTSQVCGAKNCSEKVRHGKGPYSKKYLAKMQKKCERYGTECKIDSKSRKTIRGMFHCPKCGIAWDRDFSASLSILKIFRHQSETLSLTRPEGYENTYKSSSNNTNGTDRKNAVTFKCS
jgi:hypothetical protein